jgi:hypothetical protein
MKAELLCEHIIRPLLPPLLNPTTVIKYTLYTYADLLPNLQVLNRYYVCRWFQNFQMMEIMHTKTGGAALIMRLGSRG